MRYRMLFIMLLMGLLLAACNNQSAPAPTDVPQAQSTQEPTSPVGVIVTREPQVQPPPGALPVAAPGTLVASETEDPNSGQPFQSITLVRTGGENPERITIVINGDGAYTRNGQGGILTPERVQAINEMIDTVNFFGLQGNMLGPSAETTAYQYGLTIARADTSRTIVSMDGFMPKEYIQLVGLIFETGLRP